MSVSRHNKIKERQILAMRVLSNGVEMPSCSRCERRDTKCIMSSDSSRCAECIRSGVKCDAAGPSCGDWERLQREEDRLSAEMEAAINQAQEAMAKQLRLRKQQKLLKTRGAEMLRRGLKSLDELDEAEERERAEAATPASPPREPLFGGGPMVMSFSPGFDAAALSPSYWPNWGAGGGTPPTTLGS
jgi:hypothetical protein